MFNVRNLNMGSTTDIAAFNKDSVLILQSNKRLALENAKTFEDSIRVEAYYSAMEQVFNQQIKADMIPDTATGIKYNVNFMETPFSSKTEYDSAQKLLPARERDGWFKKLKTYRKIELDNKYKHQPKQFIKDLLDKFVHTFPYLLFVSLPLYALFLKILYIRRRQFYYVDHGIFLVHLYIFTFIILLVFFALLKLSEFTNWGWIGYIQTGLILYGIFYALKAMYNFYGQRWGRTIFKFILLNILAFISLTMLFVLFFALTIFRV